MELEIGARFPAEPNEKIVVKNDGGVRNATASFAFGEVCYSSDHLKTWFVVMRIVGDQVLVEFECIPTVFGDACPNGTETNMPLVQARSRLNAYAAESDKQFMRIRRSAVRNAPRVGVRMKSNRILAAGIRFRTRAGEWNAAA